MTGYDVAKVVVEEGIKVVTTGAGNPEKYGKRILAEIPPEEIRAKLA